MQKKVLLVEDDELFREALAQFFLELGYEVSQACDGIEALKFFKDKTFNFVLSDIKMPNMDGIELLNQIKSQSKTPVVLMSGFSEVLETTTPDKLGANNFIEKPFSLDELEKIVNVY